MTSAGPQITQETNITTEGGDGSLSACKSLVIYLRFHQNENLLKCRTLARENFTSARRRRAISLSMLKVPTVLHEKLAEAGDYLCLYDKSSDDFKDTNKKSFAGMMLQKQLVSVLVSEHYSAVF